MSDDEEESSAADTDSKYSEDACCRRLPSCDCCTENHGDTIRRPTDQGKRGPTDQDKRDQTPGTTENPEATAASPTTAAPGHAVRKSGHTGDKPDKKSLSTAADTIRLSSASLLATGDESFDCMSTSLSSGAGPSMHTSSSAPGPGAFWSTSKNYDD